MEGYGVADFDSQYFDDVAWIERAVRAGNFSALASRLRQHAIEHCEQRLSRQPPPVVVDLRVPASPTEPAEPASHPLTA